MGPNHNMGYKTYQFQPAETNKMKEFKGEKYSPKRAQDHLKTLKNKLTDKKLADIHADKKVKIAERELRRVQRDLRAARRAAAAAEQEVQAAKEQQNKTHTDAKEAKGDVLYFSTAIELTAFTENEKKLTQMQKELGVLKKLKMFFKCLILEQLVSTFRKAFHSIINSRLWSSVASRFRRRKNRLQ